LVGEEHFVQKGKKEKLNRKQSTTAKEAGRTKNQVERGSGHVFGEKKLSRDYLGGGPLLRQAAVGAGQRGRKSLIKK